MKNFFTSSRKNSLYAMFIIWMIVSLLFTLPSIIEFNFGIELLIYPGYFGLYMFSTWLIFILPILKPINWLIETKRYGRVFFPLISGLYAYIVFHLITAVVFMETEALINMFIKPIKLSLIAVFIGIVWSLLYILLELYTDIRNKKHLLNE